MKKSFLIAFLSCWISSVVIAADSEPAVVYDMGGKFDKSFNEAAYMGAEALPRGNWNAVP